MGAGDRFRAVSNLGNTSYNRVRCAPAIVNRWFLSEATNHMQGDW